MRLEKHLGIVLNELIQDTRYKARSKFEGLDINTVIIKK